MRQNNEKLNEKINVMKKSFERELQTKSQQQQNGKACFKKLN